MKKALIATSTIIAILTFASVFLWAAFGYSWWEPISPGSGRGPALWFAHFVGLVQFLSMLGCMGEASRTSAAGSPS